MRNFRLSSFHSKEMTQFYGTNAQRLTVDSRIEIRSYKLGHAYGIFMETTKTNISASGTKYFVTRDLSQGKRIII